MSISTSYLAKFLRFIGVLFLFQSIGISTGYTQPAELKWFPTVKTAKDQRTLALLKAGPEGFVLLRWQDRRSDADGRITPAQPLLTVLTASGERLYDEPLPGFDNSQLDFRFAFGNDSLLLVAYEAQSGNGQTLYVRRLQLGTRKWSGAPQALFTKTAGRVPAFSTAWFSRSADGTHQCIYAFQGGATGANAAVAVFNAGFKLGWQRQVDLPPQSGPVILRRAVCCNNGSVLIHAQIFNPGAPINTLTFDTPPTIYQPDGRPPFRIDEWAVEAPAYSNAMFLLSKDDHDVAAFYPGIGKKFTPAFEIFENTGGQLFSAGFTNDEHNHAADGYFVYQIDLTTKQGLMLQNAPLPGSVRKAFLPAKAAAKKEPVEDLALRWIAWAADGRPWMLAERQVVSAPPGRLDEMALLRLDSAYRITAARKIEKFQRLNPGDPQNFASAASCATPKGGWWLLWNDGRWPDTKLILSECRNNGEPVNYQLDASARSNVTLLPQTLMQQGEKWYCVGESEYHERLRIGELEVVKKQ